MDDLSPQNKIPESKYFTWLKTTRINRGTFWFINFLYILLVPISIGVFLLFGEGLISISIVLLLVLGAKFSEPIVRILRMNDISPERNTEYMKQGPLGSFSNYFMIGFAPSRTEPQSSFDESMRIVQNDNGTFSSQKYSQLLSQNRSFKFGGLVLFALAIGTLWFGSSTFLSSYTLHQELAKNGVTTTAYYQDTRYAKGGEVYDYYFLVSNGSKYTTSSNFHYYSMDVTYDPANPNNNSTGNSPAWFIGPLFILGIGILLTIGASGCFQVVRRKV